MIDFVGLDLIVFHDLPIEKIEIKESPSLELRIEIAVYSEELDDYENSELIFRDIIELEPNEIDFEYDYEFEIYGFDYYLKDDIFFGTIVTLLGFGKPSVVFKIACKTVEVKKLLDSSTP
jgi:hypothetical protein